MYDFNKINSSFDLIDKNDDRIETYREDTMMRGDPDAVLRARDENEVKEALIYCNKNKIPVTISASQTSMTGSSVANNGLLISIEKLDGVIDINTKESPPKVVVKPGTVVADLQSAVASQGYFYPVAPTSRDECRIGGNVSTNATGEDSFKYGPIRKYINQIKVILLDGSEKILKRKLDESPSLELNKAGYFADWKNPIDLFVGSEGTLGFISEITLNLLPKSPEFFSALIPFPSNKNALEFLVKTVLAKIKNLRTIEYIDSGALSAMKTYKAIYKFPDKAKALLYIKEEFNTEKELSQLLEKLYKSVTASTSSYFADSIVIADSPKKKEDFRLWRHRIPEMANEHGREYWKNGGGKVGGDWWVPINKLLKMMDFFYSEAEKTNLPYMAYAHLGRGHPHTNLLACNPKEKEIAQEMVIRCCKMAVKLGGGVAGEHGIGKLHTDLMPIQHTNSTIQKMIKWKKEYDPNFILGRGNLFNPKII